MAGPSNALLQYIAQGARFDGADRMYKGQQQGANMLADIQAQQTRNALAQAAPMLAQGNVQGAMQSLGNAGQFEPVYKLRVDQQAAEAAAAKAALPMSSYGKTMYDETRGLVPKGTTQKQVGAIGSGGTNLTINTGDNIPLNKTGANETQKGALADAVLLQQTRNLGNLVDDEMLTYMGQAKGGIFNLRDKSGINAAKLSPKEAQYLKRRTQFVTATERLFNAYRKEITGAAAAVQELDRLKKSFINMDMGPTEFRAALSSYQAELERAYNLKTQLLAAGMPPNSEQLGRTLDLLFMSGARDLSALGLGQQGGAQQQDQGDPLLNEADAIVNGQ